MKRILTLALVAVTLTSTGCSLFKKKDQATSTPTSAGQGMDQGGAPTTLGAPADNGYNPVQIGGANSGGGTGAAGISADRSVIYFDLDSDSIRSDGQTVVAEYGRYLSANPAAKVRLEGNTDERGTREYNMGLGERRGNAVQQALLGQGASASQITVISYGEERPADPSHDESAWAKNRRVQIVTQ